MNEFKNYVHQRLDNAGVPVDPPGPHRDAGCRIGQRLDHLLDERAALRARVAELEADHKELVNARFSMSVFGVEQGHLPALIDALAGQRTEFYAEASALREQVTTLTQQVSDAMKDAARAELRAKFFGAALHRTLRSAVPNSSEHPAMHAAWEHAKQVIATNTDSVERLRSMLMDAWTRGWNRGVRNDDGRGQTEDVELLLRGVA